MVTGNELDGLESHQRQLLDGNGFDQQNFLRLAERLRRGEFTAETNRIRGKVSACPSSALTSMPSAKQADELKRLTAIGEKAIAEGKLAVVVLNGGMATRFGGRVKGVVTADTKNKKSFLALKAEHIAASEERWNGAIPLILMNSFATDTATGEHLEQHANFGLRQIHCLRQRISLRLNPDASLYRDADGLVSPYAPGHGDIFEVVGESQPYADFLAAGGTTLWLWNVDNLGATIDTAILGAHIDGHQQVSVEVVERFAGDTGGAPVLVDGKLQLLEGFRFPVDFDSAQVPVFNTNTLLVDVGQMRTHPLGWYRADKKVGTEQTPVVQFERIMGEVSAFSSTQYLWVPREGNNSRFLPVKTPEDLDRMNR